MAIDISLEQAIPLAGAAAMLPRRRAGKKTHLSALYRWTNQGLRGIRLEYIQIGATRCTSSEALARFFTALTAQSMDGKSTPAPPRPTSARRRKQIEAAERRLRKAGV